MQGAYVIGLLRHIFDHFYVAILCMREGLETLLLVCDSWSDDTAILWVESHKYPRILIEHDIDLFECAARRLDPAEVSQRNEGRTNRGPNPEVVAADIV